MMHLRTLEMFVLKYMNFILKNFFHLLDLHGKRLLEKTKVKLDLLNDTDMLLMIEKGIRGGICHSVYQYSKGSNKYIKD